MMPDLGKYGVYVLSAYGASILLLIGLVALTLRAGRKARSDLSDVERQRGLKDAD
jgi:heme exporter protein D